MSNTHSASNILFEQGRVTEESLANQALPRKTNSKSALETEASLSDVLSFTSLECCLEEKHWKLIYGSEL